MQLHILMTYGWCVYAYQQSQQGQSTFRLIKIKINTIQKPLTTVWFTFAFYIFNCSLSLSHNFSNWSDVSIIYTLCIRAGPITYKCEIYIIAKLKRQKKYDQVDVNRIFNTQNNKLIRYITNNYQTDKILSNRLQIELIWGFHYVNHLQNENGNSL